ncbi:hypothetical protein L4X63_09260 [Geomonas sp. Red32]|uniref:hypothetical protein n=1 Tax=Geomonas sp. Red32 TaxID=2912856 RepID=UPI00202CB697|nr:hypothetical protein [Geomonas sp. Red32]MCM0081776.1 hypothetical protein [Geomonas sp. Red32]
MSSISIVYIEVDGTDYSDNVVKVYEGKISSHKPQNFMHRTGSLRLLKRPTVGFDWGIEEGVAEPDFSSLEDVTITIIYEDGTRIQYLGCTHTDRGEVTYDEENGSIVRHDFKANKRVVE